MKFTKTILSNGLRLVTVPMIDNPSVTVLVMVEAGSKYETKEINGLSHFLEHMVFKGTPRRPKATDISRELDSLGAHYNAFTSQECTGYYAKVAAHKLDSALDIVSDLFLNPLFPVEEIEKEKGVIVEEIRMYQDMPHRDVHEVLTELMYGDQPAGWRIIGSEDNVKSFTREQLLAYRQAHYVSAASTVVVAGSFDEPSTIAKIQTLFAGMTSTTKQGKVAVIENQSKPAIRIKFKETDQTHIALAVRTFSIFDTRTAAMNVLSTILGKGMSSRLFAKMRDQLGICYYISASQSSYTDHGELTISAGVDASRVDEALKGILEECRSLKDELVPEAELQKAKDYLVGTTMLELETSEARSEFFGSQEVIKGKIETLENSITKINTVTASEIQKLAREIFVDAHLNMALIGKMKDDSQFTPYFTLGS
jgi:predicted Zn-dependent peptidase